MTLCSVEEMGIERHVEPDTVDGDGTESREKWLLDRRDEPEFEDRFVHLYAPGSSKFLDAFPRSGILRKCNFVDTICILIKAATETNILAQIRGLYCLTRCHQLTCFAGDNHMIPLPLSRRGLSGC
jgi:hypothetical protein